MLPHVRLCLTPAFMLYEIVQYIIGYFLNLLLFSFVWYRSENVLLMPALFWRISVRICSFMLPTASLPHDWNFSLKALQNMYFAYPAKHVFHCREKWPYLD